MRKSEPVANCGRNAGRQGVVRPTCEQSSVEVSAVCGATSENMKGLCTMSSLSPDQFRSRFPIFGRRIYVNSCSQGALSLDVEAAIHEYTASWHEGGSAWELWVEKVEELRGVFAASIGADRDEIAVMPSASGGINAVASALDFHAGRSGVTMGEFEFPTMAQVWLAQQRRGAVVEWARAAGDRLDMD